MPPLRVSAISYLNTAPLMWSFEHGSEREKLREQFEVHYTLPAVCARELAEGAADIGIIPVAAYTTIPDLQIIPDVAIAAKASVRSILLVSRKPMSSIATVALDSSSRTSAALIKVLFARHWERKVEFAEADPNLEAMLAASDAALLIGDPALSVDRSQFHTWDLGEEWRRFTGKPFVFAFWAVRSGAAEAPSLAHVARVFQLSQVEGLNHLDSISHEWATKLKLGESVVRAYLTRNIDYSLDAENVAGMELFFRHAAEVGALPAAPRLRFLESGRSALTR